MSASKATRFVCMAGFLAVLSLALGAIVYADGPVSPTKDTPDTSATLPTASHRLIVQLESPPLALYSPVAAQARTPEGQLDVKSPSARAHIQRLEAEQARFVNRMQAALPGATVGTYINEYGMEEEATYQVVLNAVTVDPGDMDRDVARRQLAKLPGVKRVYLDLAYTPDLYSSNELINSPQVWDNPEIGGRQNAGAGIKVASMDGGVHHEAPMFDGTGYTYPPGYPKGLTANTNGKIIVSRVYFRPWDPPAEGDRNPWPGENGTAHGVHTAGIAAGDIVTGTYLGLEFPNMSGVAPKAYVMSYRVFYASVNNIGAFYTAEGLAALEDIVLDGANVLNNSWGGGPSSAGGEFDVLDTALVNAVKAGVFVSMSAGNAGPGLGTTDHPSQDYIVVGATTTNNNLAAGRFSIIEPEPALRDIAFTTALFGPSLELGQVITYPYLTSDSVDPANIEGCKAWPVGTFDGYAAVIKRGACNFSLKVYYAQEAGAEFVVIRNHESGGETLINMAPGDRAEDVTISSIFIGYSDGLAVVDKQANAEDAGETAILQVDTNAYIRDTEPDELAVFSSHGPGVGYVLRPDIAAPGVSILSQGYTPGVTGEARHLGYGQASGTSMAAPHVAGAAALLRQIYPTWTPADIKSALMSTATYTDIYDYDGSPAQPLDIGAGRLDVAAAVDPGVIFEPPILSFGAVMTGTTNSIVIQVDSVSTNSETYDITTLYTGAGFAPTQTTTLPGFTVEPASITLEPDATASFTVTFDTTAGQGLGDNQGYIVLDGDNGHDAHLPAWARVLPEPAEADVLLIGSDFSYLLGYPNYFEYYANALEDLGFTYEFWNADHYFNNPTTIPDATTLSKYDAIIIYTGDHWQYDGYFTVPTPFTALDADRLMEYLNGGGIIFAMGQDLSSVLQSTETNNGDFFYQIGLGGNWLQDSVSDFSLPSAPIIPLSYTPPAFDGISLDLSGPEIYSGTIELLTENVVTFELYLPVIMKGGITGRTTAVLSRAGTDGASLSGEAAFVYDEGSNRLDYDIAIEDIPYPIEMTVTINRGASGENGPAAYTLFAESTVMTDTLVLDDALLLQEADGERLLNGELYIAVETTESEPFDALRGNIMVEPVIDGAANQFFVDELAHRPDLRAPNPTALEPGYMPLLRYGEADGLIRDGIVAMSHRDQPTLERPGISYFGRSIYTSFGLEGVNGEMARANLVETFFNWAMDEPTVTITNTTTPNASNLTTFQAVVQSDVPDTTGWLYRWHFGDGTGIYGPYGYSHVGHTYEAGGVYTVTVEVTDNWGNKAIASTPFYIPTRLTLLHNNDGESELLPGDDNFGGVAHFASVVERERMEVGDAHPLLLVTSGDNFLAGPEWSASREKGVPFYDSIALDLIGYDAMAIGNHDFDFGPDTLANFIEGFTVTEVPFVSANLDFSEEPMLEALVEENRIAASVIVEEEGEWFGIVGATTPNLPFISSPGDVEVSENVQAAVQAEIDALEAAGVNKIILISHLQGIEEDMALAPHLSGLDIMVAGGGDELLANPDDLLIPGDETEIQGPYPIVVQNAEGFDVPVVTTSGEYEYLGRLDVRFDQQGHVVSFTGGPIRVAGGKLPDAVEPDEEMEEQVVEPVAEYVEGLSENVLATSEVALDGRRNEIRSRETNEGDLITDAFLWKAKQIHDEFGAPAPDIAMANGGGIRNDSIIPPGDITELNTFSMLPFPNFLTIVPDVTPETFKDLLENAVSRINAAGEPEGEGTGRFAQIAGFSFTYDSTLPEGDRVISATLDDGTVMIEGGEIAPTAIDLNIVVVDFLARGGDEYFGGPPGRDDFIILGTSYQQALADYLETATAQGGLGGTISASEYPEGGEDRIRNLAVSP